MGLPSPSSAVTRSPKAQADMKKEHLIYLVIFLAGVIGANKVRTLPGLSKLPSL